MVPAFRPKSSMQASSAAENSQKCTSLLHQAPVARRRIAPASPVTAGAPGLTSQIFPPRMDPAVRSARRGPDMSEDDLGGKPWVSGWGRFQPRLFVAEADAQRLGLAHQIALGVDKLELAGDLLERHVAHLAVAQGNHVAKLAAQAAERRFDATLGRKRCGPERRAGRHAL